MKITPRPTTGPLPRDPRPTVADWYAAVEYLYGRSWDGMLVGLSHAAAMTIARRVTAFLKGED